MNDNLLLIAGKSSTGKSASLMNLADPEGVIYLNCENNKKLPFKSQFKERTVLDPYQIYEVFEKAETMDVHTIVIDSLTYMMEMFESLHVLTAPNTMKAWSEYAQFFKNLMFQYVASSHKNVIFTGHTMDILNEDKVVETYIKVKGSLMNTGIESFFSTVLATKRLPLKSLQDYGSDLLNITTTDELLGYKYVYQTLPTKETVNERIRGPLRMWDIEETFIDNDAQNVIERLHNYYS